MKQILILILLTVIYSCVSLRQGQYKVGLENVDVSGIVFSDIVSVDSQSDIYRFQDSIINIVWQVRDKDFAFKLLNKANKSIKIIWDDAVYVDINGLSKRIIHKGVKYTNRNESQPSSTIAKNTLLDEIVMPAENIDYSNNGAYTTGWEEKPLFPNTGLTKEESNQIATTYMGKEIKIVLPIKIGEETKEYTFSFRVKEFIPN